MLVLASAFRLFFLLAAILAILWVPAWTLLATQNRALSSSLGAMGWHAHEMIFGYTGAVLAGFLLTAARQWTSRATLSGAPLGALILLWALGRVAVLHASQTAASVSLVIDATFFMALALAIGIPIARSRSRRNYAFPFLVAWIGVCDLAIHLHMRGVAPVLTARANMAAIDGIVIVMLIFAGRIVPLFTKGATDAAVRVADLRDTVGIWLMVFYAAAHSIAPQHLATHASAILVGAVTCSRLYGWGTSQTLGKPIVWVLHLSWLLIGLAIGLEGLNGLTQLVPPNSFLHLLTIGGIGLMTFAMLARVSLGHTGRKLHVPRSVALGFAALVVAAIARVAAPIASPAYYSRLLWIASSAWSLAFIALLVFLAPMLLSPRADGKEG